APKKAGTAATHGAPLGAEEVTATRAALDWPHAPFIVPEEILAAWRVVAERGQQMARDWETHFEVSEHKEEITRRQQGQLPDGWQGAIKSVIDQLQQEKPKQATRQLSQNVLNALAAVVPELVGGSADLTGSTNTKSKGQQDVTATDF